MPDRPLYPAVRLHREALEGEYGIWQHASGPRPNEAFGYDTDDVARALTVDLLHAPRLGWSAVAASAWRSIEFLEAALNPTTGRFRNFRASDGEWLEASGSEDSHGRAILSLGTLLGKAPDPDAADRGGALLLAALPAAKQLESPRAIASCVLGCAAAMAAGLGGETQATLEMLSERLARAFARAKNDPDWPWPEDILSYENALLPRAVMTAGSVLGDYELRRTGLRAFDWLIEAQRSREATSRPWQRWLVAAWRSARPVRPAADRSHGHDPRGERRLLLHGR